MDRRACHTVACRLVACGSGGLVCMQVGVCMRTVALRFVRCSSNDKCDNHTCCPPHQSPRTHPLRPLTGTSAPRLTLLLWRHCQAVRMLRLLQGSGTAEVCRAAAAAAVASQCFPAVRPAPGSATDPSRPQRALSAGVHLRSASGPWRGLFLQTSSCHRSCWICAACCSRWPIRVSARAGGAQVGSSSRSNG
jgi:hypothetical protein